MQAQPSPDAARQNAANQSILIVKIGAIGDVAMAMPMVAEIRRRSPRAKITWLCGSVPRELLAMTPDIDELIAVDETKLFRGSLFARLGALFGVWRALWSRSFDLICIGHSDRRYGLLTRGCRTRNRRAFFDRRGLISGRHHTFEYIRLVTGEDGPDADVAVSPPCLKLPDPTGLFSRKADARLVLLAPGGAQNAMRTDALRRWPLESYAALASKLLAQNIQVVLIGAPSDSYVRQAFIGLDVVDIIGRTNLPLLTSAIAMADAIVSHDSSAIHLAHLVDAPVIGLFGPTVMGEKLFARNNAWGLWGGEELTCRPCYDGKNYFPCTNNLCMQSISVAAVEDRVHKALALRKIAPT